MTMSMQPHAGAQGGFPWPTVTDFLALKRTRATNIGRRLQVSAALAYARLLSRPLVTLSRRCPAGSELFQQCPNLYRGLLGPYVDARLSLPTRIRVIAREVQEVVTRLQQAGQGAASVHQPHTLWRLAEGDWRVDLQVNTASPHEGLWVLALKAGDDTVVYSLSFACMGHALWIGAVQGPKGEGALARVRDATKALHGLRPHFFLVEVLRALAQAWGRVEVQGVDARHHPQPSGLWRRREGVKFDYAGFWRELGGVQAPSQRWRLPMAAPRKALDDIESKKRAMYRRRFAMLDAMTREIAVRFSAPTSGTPADRPCPGA